MNVDPQTGMIDVKSLYPRSSSWTERCRFYCQTSSVTDFALPFMAGMWSLAMARNGLQGGNLHSAEAYYEKRLGELGLTEADFGFSDEDFNS